MKKLITLFAMVSMFAMLGFADESRSKELERVNSAQNVLTEIMSAPDKGIPQEILSGADCVLIIPSMKQGGFIVGARYGKGVGTCRNENRWSAPAPVRIEGGSYGLQIGAEGVDLVMLIMNQKGLQHLLSSKFKIGADASAAAGPVGRHAEAGTNWKLQSELLTYSRAKGAFAGITLNGAVVKQDEDDTTALYGKMVPFATILRGSVPPPAGTTNFVSTVARYFQSSREAEGKSASAAPASSGGVSGTAVSTKTTASKSDTSNAVASDTSRAGTGRTTTAVTSGGASNNDVQEAIQKDLRNEPGMSDSNVQVTVNDNSVKLDGSVNSQEARNHVVSVATSQAGNRKVEDSGLNVRQ